MIKVNFIYKGESNITLCNINENINTIISRLNSEINKMDINSLNLLYKGKIININSTILQLLSDEKGKTENNIIIHVLEQNESKDNIKTINNKQEDLYIMRYQIDKNKKYVKIFNKGFVNKYKNICKI